MLRYAWIAHTVSITYTTLYNDVQLYFVAWQLWWLQQWNSVLTSNTTVDKMAPA